MTLFFLILLVISLVIFAFTHWRIKPRQKKPSIKPLLPAKISKNQLGLSEVNIGKINFGPPPAPVNQPTQPILPTPLNEPVAPEQPTPPTEPTQIEPPPNLPI